MDFYFDKPDSFTTGAFGPKGERTFFIQTSQGESTIAIKVEKSQVEGLVGYLEQLLEMYPSPGATDLRDEKDSNEKDSNTKKPSTDEPSTDSPTDSSKSTDTATTAEPESLMWAAGDLEIGYSEKYDRIAVFINEFDTEADKLHVMLRREQTVAFIRQARKIISAGRPLCTFCGDPLNFDNGFCPCYN